MRLRSPREWTQCAGYSRLRRIASTDRPTESQVGDPKSRGKTIWLIKTPRRYDGCRTAAGFRGKPGACVACSIAVATGLPYRHIYELLTEQAWREHPAGGPHSSARNGVFRETCHRCWSRWAGVG